MTIWSTRPDSGDIRPPTRLLRVKPGHPLAGIITSSTLLGTYLHYYRGRTTPCTGADCEACNTKLHARWYGFASLWAPRSNAHEIIELTATCIPTIEAYETKHGTLRGAQLTLHRANNKANSRLVAELTMSNYSHDAIPSPLDIADTLEWIWERHTNKPAEPPQQQQPQSPRFKVSG